MSTNTDQLSERGSQAGSAQTPAFINSSRLDPSISLSVKQPVPAPERGRAGIQGLQAGLPPKEEPTTEDLTVFSSPLKAMIGCLSRNQQK